MPIPIVSIVTPSFNQGRFIDETIRSVISQEGDFHLEYLIMDGGSKDNTIEILKKYDQILKEGKWDVKCCGIEYRWVSEKDRGQTDAVNKGFKSSKGEVLGWLNSDDTYLPGAISKAVKYFNEHEDVMMVYGEGYHTNEDGSIKERYYTEPFDFKRLAELCFICQPAVFLRRKILSETGLLNVELHYCMDYDYWIRIAKKLKIGYLPEYLANSRLYAETKTMSKRLEAHSEIVDVVKRHYGKVPNSWISAFAHVRVERWLTRSTKFKNYLFCFLEKWIFLYKFISINRSFPGFSFKRGSDKII